MKRQSGLLLYIGIIGCLTATVLGAAVFFATRMAPGQLLSYAPTAIILVGLGCYASRQQVYLGETTIVVMGTVAQIATLLLLPFPVAIIAIALAKALSLLSLAFMAGNKMRSWRAAVVNLGNIVLATAAGGAAFYLAPGHQYLWSHDRAFLAFPALIALAALYCIIDVLVPVGAASLSSGTPPWSVFRSLVRDMFLPMLSLIFLGIVVGVMWHFSPAFTLCVAAPIIISVRAFESVARLRKETVEAVLKMAESIDYRDTGTYEHSQRLADLTKRLARGLGLLGEDVNQVVLAARVHDLGKIGISNDILLKQGPLTPDERQIMQDHPVIGANILASYSAFQDSVPIVRHHHEHWDGRGYPDGLKGEEIPIGSRIISVVDAFDSMIADRPYRKGMSVEIAVDRLKAGIGTQFDPRVCATFVQLLIEEGVYVPPQPAADLHVVRREAS